ncbi:putative pre-mRNA-splicing factor ATP-dependent RNA helicase DHX32 [Lates japonicus]|uniref:Pre-mRNA-splicing factor ATP-dependent RNA helicase DHX32 n=1 Tax=Lates japonicus TaxID=270547 RepID=A0AAD3RDK6_LATJO|nr:putative pre-mRNA-splicing factor ATP-dependent RNA helicase DHX32 [Lates japonicus]
MESKPDILCHERHSCPCYRAHCLLPYAWPAWDSADLGEEEAGRIHEVFLGPSEDFFWAIGSINFVIDAGLKDM